MLDSCLPELAPSVTAQAFVEYWFEKDSRVEAAVLAECDELRRRGVTIFLATNQEHMRARYLMDRMGLRDHVDGMIYSADISARKPQRAFFDAALTRSGSSPENTLLVDDTLANVEAALEAGWQAAHWSVGASLVQLFDK